MSVRILLAAMVMVATAGCESPEYGRLSLHRIAGDMEADVGSGTLFVPRGGVLVFEAEPRSAGVRDYQGWEELELSSAQPDVGQLRPAIRRDAWVLTGKREGTGVIDVYVDGQRVDALEFEVAEVAP